MIPFFSRRPADSSSSNPDDLGEDLRMLAAILKDDKAWLDGVESQVAIDELTKIWKEKIKAWAYDAEDVLDEWNFEQLCAEVEIPPARGSGRANARDPVAHLLMEPSFRDRFNALMRKRRAIRESNRQFRLEGPPPYGKNVEPLPTSSLLTEREIHDREEDKGILVEFLLRKAVEDKLSVVPVLGAPDVVKSTFLQHICNDELVSQHFNLKAWMSASRGPRMTELMKETAESLTGVRCNYTQLGAVQNFLKRGIDGRRFLLVFDDVRYETIDGDQWKNLCVTFSGCAHGSVVILTTQEERVAERTKTVPPYMLESLSGDIFWSVFRKQAFPGSLPTDAQLHETGQKIGKECQGLPLVAKALGFKLCHERDRENWDGLFLQREMWDVVLPQLKLSYLRLPPHLKRCFVYCSMFPRGYLFSREELIWLWMAQGFMKEEWGRSLEDVGVEYFDALFMMSFFQKSELDTGAFVMPNLIHALAQSNSDGECITTEYSNLGNIPWNNLQKARHLSLTSSNSELSASFLSIATNLRSFLVVPARPLINIAHISLPDAAFHSLNLLRALDLRYTDIRALPNTISNLKHLRYLNLRGTKIGSVNVSVFQLYNLQTLDLSYTEIRELPDAIGNLWTYDEGSDNDVMPNYRDLEEQFIPQSDQMLHNQGVGDMADSSINSLNDHVDDRDSSSNDAMRKVEHIGNEFCGSPDRNGFPKLEKLSFVNMRRWKEWNGVGEGDFPHLSELIIFNCPNLKGVPCLHSPLIKLKVERCAVDSIPTPKSLEDLELLACDNLVALAKLPSLSSLRNLTLMCCQNLTSLPTVPSLDSLWIEECEKLNISFLGELETYKLSSTTFTIRVQCSDCRPLISRADKLFPMSNGGTSRFLIAHVVLVS
ncbi:hypothetical protein Taro_023825 [Colocasia esculenta]|uniref:NB-ARC domain-containing protein n=1 Tax=Colocasia esculenta TaxID=4460 RepID=A0A843VFM1_COLES|nr:hypothetical protein [Colocasia esculenta]